MLNKIVLIMMMLLMTVPLFIVNYEQMKIINKQKIEIDKSRRLYESCQIAFKARGRIVKKQKEVINDYLAGFKISTKRIKELQKLFIDCQCVKKEY